MRGLPSFRVDKLKSSFQNAIVLVVVPYAALESIPTQLLEASMKACGHPIFMFQPDSIDITRLLVSTALQYTQHASTHCAQQLLEEVRRGSLPVYANAHPSIHSTAMHCCAFVTICFICVHKTPRHLSWRGPLHVSSRAVCPAVRNTFHSRIALRGGSMACIWCLALDLRVLNHPHIKTMAEASAL
jgi:hypothetical protein